MAKPIPPHLNQSRLKTTLKMAISKLKFVQEKKTAITKQQRRQLSELLSQGKESSAKIRVENIIRDDIYIELLEYLELYCELLLARLAILIDRPNCETNLLEAVSSIIYAANHTELKELIQIKEILMFKYGNEFLQSILDNKESQVSEKIVKRCDIEPPNEVLVDLYLCEIAKAYNVPFSGLSSFGNDEEDDNADEKNNNNDDDGDEGGTKELADKPSVKKLDAKPKLKDQDEFDALRARFAALKGSPS